MLASLSVWSSPDASRHTIGHRKTHRCRVSSNILRGYRVPCEIRPSVRTDSDRTEQRCTQDSAGRGLLRFASMGAMSSAKAPAGGDGGRIRPKLAEVACVGQVL